MTDLASHDLSMMSGRLASPSRDADARNGRYALDGARGLASLKVMLGHTLWIGEHWSDRGHWWVKYSPLELVLDPRIAVYMFFVLSGYALYAVLDRVDDFSYLGFLARRLVRIGLPLLATCVMAFVMVVICRQVQIDRTSYFRAANDEWLLSNVSNLFESMLLIGNWNSLRLDPALWSLVYELRASLLFPFFFVAFRRWPKPVVAISLASGVVAGILLAHRKANFFWTGNLVDAVLFTAFLFLPFVIGACLRRYQNQFAAIVAPRPWTAVMMLVPTYVAFRALRLPAGNAGILRMIFGAMVLLCALYVPPLRRALGSRALRFCGSISYSLYLTHSVVIATVTSLLSNVFSPVLLVLISVVGSLVTAVVFCRFVEQPAHRFAKSISWTRSRPHRDVAASGC